MKHTAWPQKSLLVAALFLAACAGPSLKKEIIRDDPSYSKPRATAGILRELADAVTSEHGVEYSGFRLLDSSYDGLNARLALIDSATSSIDIQTYLWYPDNS